MNTNLAIADELMDIRDVSLDTSMPIKQRRDSFLKQIKNPYRFKYNNMVVSLEFTGETTLEEKLVSHFIEK